MTTRAVIVHGWEGTPDHGWYPWLKKELEKRGIAVTVPAMPDTNNPKLTKWLPHLQSIIGQPDENLYLIGHSLGCITILRYLESLTTGQKIGGAVLVAGFSDNLGYNELDSFFTTPIRWEKIRSRCYRFVAIHSDNDPYVPLKHGDIFKEKLGAQLIIKHSKGHFSGDDGITEVPDVLNAVLAMARQ